MYFKSLKLKNFRNYKSLELNFNKKLNLIMGKNAQGKTNLLESLYIMGLGKSFRTNNDKEMIGFGEEFAKAVCTISDEDDEREKEISIVYNDKGKIIRLDGQRLQRSSELLENVYLVVFSPDDLKIVKEGPANRRRFLDRELCQIKPVYYSDLGNYKRVLKQRNQLLKSRKVEKKLIEVFDESLANYGFRIAEERKLFVTRLQEISYDIHSRISEGKENLRLAYETDIKDKESYIKKLSIDLDKDIEKGYTAFGPHKDDISIEVNDKDIRIYGSQGQQRTAALSLKLAEIGIIKQETGENAVLLLDDVMSELDKRRQEFLIAAMKDVQVFISAAEMNEELINSLPKGDIYYVDNGIVNLYNIKAIPK